MKKITSIILTAILTASLTACSANEPNKSAPDEEKLINVTSPARPTTSRPKTPTAQKKKYPKTTKSKAPPRRARQKISPRKRKPPRQFPRTKQTTAKRTKQTTNRPALPKRQSPQARSRSRIIQTARTLHITASPVRITPNVIGRATAATALNSTALSSR